MEDVLESVGTSQADARILLVEDDSRLRSLTARLLRDGGYTVVEAQNGEHAVSVAAGHLTRFDLVLTDVNMPGKSGPQLVEALRASRPDLRFVYISGYTTGLLSESSVIETGAVFLEKPFTRAGLLNTIRDALERPGTTRSPGVRLALTVDLSDTQSNGHGHRMNGQGRSSV